jgi:hypothetical protein
MPSKRQQNRGYLLPQDPDPIDGYELLCVNLKIPNHPAYRAAFRGTLERLSKWWTWEKSYTEGDTRASQAAAYWREIFNEHLKIGECGRGDDCIELPLHDPRIEWYPNDPYRTPYDVPPGYLFPPWYIANAINIIGARTGDIVTDFARITGIIGWNNSPRLRINLTGSGIVQVYMVPVIKGALALYQADGELFSLRYVDTNKDIGETNDEIIIEHKFTTPGDHFLDITMGPNLDENLIPVSFGGGIRKIVICGFDAENPCPECPPPPPCPDCPPPPDEDCGCCDDDEPPVNEDCGCCEDEPAPPVIEDCGCE